MSVDEKVGVVSMPADVRNGAKVGPPPAFDPECSPALVAAQAVFPEPVTSELLPVIRQMVAYGDPTDADLERGGAYRVQEKSAPGLEGAPAVPLLVCTPTAAKAPTPAVYYVHGGGMISGGRRSDMGWVLDYAEAEGLAVVGVEYRLAPEHPDPAPIDDCYAGLLWIIDHAEELNIDPDRILIFGMSAGGGLAAGVALRCRDQKGPKLIGQMLTCPMLDERNDTASSFQFQGNGSWIRESNEFGWNALLGDRRRRAEVSPYTSPSRAADLSDLPPTFLDVGSAEVFRDEAVDYASRIWAAGGNAELHVWPGGYHGFDRFAPAAAVSQDATRARARWLHRLLSQQPTQLEKTLDLES